MPRTRRKPREVVEFLKFARTILGSTARVGMPCCTDEDRCARQFIAMLRDELGFVMEYLDALEVIRLRPSRMTDAGRTFVYANTPQVIEVLARARVDRRATSRKE